MSIEMSCLKVENEEGQTVGVIPIYCGESTLANIRKEIEDDFEINNSWFMRGGSTLETSEEVCTSVASIARDIVDHFTGKRFFSITISNSLKLGATADSMNENEPLKTTGFDSTTTVASGMMPIPKTSKTEENNPCSSTSKATGSFLRSPTSWEVRGVKIYTQNDVQKAKGMEKKRREFWNKEVKRLCRETNKSKNNIMKEVNIAWRQYHGTLLLEEENLLQKLQVDNNSQTISKCKPGTLQKNFDRIRQNKNELDQVINEIDHTKAGSVVGKKRKLDELEDKKSCLLGEMKKAQDALRKNLKKSVNFVKDLSNDI